MKQRKPIKIAALKNIAIIPLLFLHPLSAKAQINDHIIVWLNNIMDPPDIAQRIQQDPSFVTWQANTYYPQPDPTAIAAADSTTLPLDEESSLPRQVMPFYQLAPPCIWPPLILPHEVLALNHTR